MFWVLVGMAAAVLAPCILLPVWREYQALRYAEQVEQAGLEQARAELGQQRRRLQALQNDPAVIARVARRELRYRDPQETVVPVSVPPEEPIETAPLVLKPVEPPSALRWLVDLLPETDYDRLFCAGPTRTTLMGLAAGLVLSAFVIYSPRRTVRSSKFKVPSSKSRLGRRETLNLEL
ncbi:MAG: septum formation initiator family protein [Planctomycetota bacterium]